MQRNLDANFLGRLDVTSGFGSPGSWNECPKNADISILSNFLAICFSITTNFANYYLRAKFQINWTIQTEITEGAESALPGQIKL